MQLHAILLMDGNIMKLKHLTLLLGITCVFSVHSDIDDAKEERMRILSELGLPLPDSGIKIIPRAQLDLPKSLLEEGKREEKEMKEKGYAHSLSSRPQELLNFKYHAQDEFKKYKNSQSDTATHIRHSLDELKISYKPKPIPDTLASKYIGVAPQGSFKENGWSGVAQFFETSDSLACAYGEMNVKAAHTAAELAMESITYEVHNKPTLITVKGDKYLGFVYKIDWFDDEIFHNLECASKEYSSLIKDKVLTLADNIDRR